MLLIEICWRGSVSEASWAQSEHRYQRESMCLRDVFKLLMKACSSMPHKQSFSEPEDMFITLSDGSA